jgi:hypothetical protein
VQVISAKGSSARELVSLEVTDGVFDVAWSEAVDGHIAVASGSFVIVVVLLVKCQ